MLEQVLLNLNNWFAVPDGTHAGEFTIEGGGITLPFLSDGQYFRIIGSVFNDGLHRYPAEGLKDETFTGAVWALAVPQAVIELAGEIEKWQEKNGEAALSPFASESFGGYSYSKPSGDGAAVSWQTAFRAQLSPWRKIKGAMP